MAREQIEETMNQIRQRVQTQVMRIADVNPAESAMICVAYAECYVSLLSAKAGVSDDEFLEAIIEWTGMMASKQLAFRAAKRDR
jgi:hypothetical protein